MQATCEMPCWPADMIYIYACLRRYRIWWLRKMLICGDDGPVPQTMGTHMVRWCRALMQVTWLLPRIAYQNSLLFFQDPYPFNWQLTNSQDLWYFSGMLYKLCFPQNILLEFHNLWYFSGSSLCMYGLSGSIGWITGHLVHEVQVCIIFFCFLV